MGLLEGLKQGMYSGLRSGFTDNKWANGIVGPGPFTIFPAKADLIIAALTPTISIPVTAAVPDAAGLLIEALTPTVTIRQTIGVTNVLNGQNTTNGTVFITGNWTPVANRLYVLTLVYGDTVSPAAPSSVVSTTGITWVLVNSNTINTSQRGIHVYRGMKSSGLVLGLETFTWAATNETAGWSIEEFTGVPTTGTDGADAVVQTTTITGATVTALTSTLAAFENAQNIHLASYFTQANAAITAGTGFNQLVNFGVTSPAGRMETQWKVNDVDCDTTFASTTAAAVSLEIKSNTIP